MKTLLLKRDGAIGDCLLMTPIIKRAVDEGWRVWVQTKCGEVFKNNPYVDKIFEVGRKGGIRASTGQFKVVDLNLAYEKRPKMHIVDAYSEVVFRDRKTERWPIWLFQTTSRYEEFKTEKTKEELKEIGITVAPIDYQNSIVIHQGVGWENRTFSENFWRKIIISIVDGTTYNCLIVGKHTDYTVGHELNSHRIICATGVFNLHELAYVIDKAKLFIGPDSAPLHIAQTTSTPCIGLFTCARAEYRLTSPHAVAVVPLSREDDVTQEPFRSDKHPAVLECHGCLHDEPPPVTYVGCRRGDFICVRERITPGMVMEKVKEILT